MRCSGREAERRRRRQRCKVRVDVPPELVASGHHIRHQRHRPHQITRDRRRAPASRKARGRRVVSTPQGQAAQVRGGGRRSHTHRGRSPGRHHRRQRPGTAGPRRADSTAACSQAEGRRSPSAAADQRRAPEGKSGVPRWSASTGEVYPGRRQTSVVCNTDVVIRGFRSNETTSWQAPKISSVGCVWVEAGSEETSVEEAVADTSTSGDEATGGRDSPPVERRREG